MCRFRPSRKALSNSERLRIRHSNGSTRRSLYFFGMLTASRFRPFLRLWARTLRPFAVAMRARKPWHLFRRMRLGWNVYCCISGPPRNAPSDGDLHLFRKTDKIGKSAKVCQGDYPPPSPPQVPGVGRTGAQEGRLKNATSQGAPPHRDSRGVTYMVAVRRLIRLLRSWVPPREPTAAPPARPGFAPTLPRTRGETDPFTDRAEADDGTYGEL